MVIDAGKGQASAAATCTKVLHPACPWQATLGMLRQAAGQIRCSTLLSDDDKPTARPKPAHVCLRLA